MFSRRVKYGSVRRDLLFCGKYLTCINASSLVGHTHILFHRVVEPPNTSEDPAVAETETGVCRPGPHGPVLHMMAFFNCFQLAYTIVQLEFSGQLTHITE